LPIRPPKNLSNTLSFETGAAKTGANALEAELLSEKALSLGLAARTMQKSLETLKTYAGSGSERPLAVQSSADCVQAYFIQRELLGFSDHAPPIKYYEIPRDVLSKVGVKNRQDKR